MKSVLLFLALAAPCAIALKLSITNICILPALALFLILTRKNLKDYFHEYRLTTLPLLAFLFIIFYSAFFGLDIGNSLIHAGKISYAFLIIPLYSLLAAQGFTKQILFLLTCGLTVASLHTVFEGAYPTIMFEYSHGANSEAGQLAIGFFCTIALFLMTRKEISNAKISDVLRYSALPCLGFLVLGFSNALSLSSVTKSILAAACFLYVVWFAGRAILSLKKESHLKEVYIFSLCVALPLLSAALLLNLKRGPWVGSLGALFLLFCIIKPKLLIPTVPLALAILFGFEPIRLRAFSSLEHFFTVGGRGEIWNLGGELLIRYPLGIGFENAAVIKDFSFDIPNNLNHFHSNIINIAVELGWVGLVAYLWWIGSVLYKGLVLQDRRSTEGITTICLACGLFAWQIAGLFEYNFGDSEVFLLALMITGLVVGSPVAKSDNEDTEPEKDACPPKRPIITFAFAG